jgi:hypothetical protein
MHWRSTTPPEWGGFFIGIVKPPCAGWMTGSKKHPKPLKTREPEKAKIE